MIRQGDLYWMDLPDPAGSGPGFRRPVVVVQSDLFNESRLATALVCALTGNLRHAAAPGNVLIPGGEGGLPQDSVALVIQVFTIDKAALVEWIGSLPPGRLRQVISGIHLVTAVSSS